MKASMRIKRVILVLFTVALLTSLIPSTVFAVDTTDPSLGAPNLTVQNGMSLLDYSIYQNRLTVTNGTTISASFYAYDAGGLQTVELFVIPRNGGAGFDVPLQYIGNNYYNGTIQLPATSGQAEYVVWSAATDNAGNRISKIASILYTSKVIATKLVNQTTYGAGTFRIGAKVYDLAGVGMNTALLQLCRPGIPVTYTATDTTCDTSSNVYYYYEGTLDTDTWYDTPGEYIIACDAYNTNGRRARELKTINVTP